MKIYTVNEEQSKKEEKHADNMKYISAVQIVLETA
jgi:hypothetical protein